MNHMGTKPLKEKEKKKKKPFTNPADHDTLAPRLQSSVLAKLCTCEAVRDRKFLKSYGSRLLCVHTGGGDQGRHRGVGCLLPVPAESPLTLSWPLLPLTSWSHCFWTNQHYVSFLYSLPEA